MTFDKRIYIRPDMGTKKGKVFANVHLLVGYNKASLEDYQKMAEELRKTFPKAKDSKLRCSQVTKSSSVDGFTLLAYDAFIDKKEYDGWLMTKNIPEYSFT